MSTPRTPLQRSPIDNLEQVAIDIYKSLFDVSNTDGEELLRLLTICELLDKAIEKYESNSKLTSLPVLGPVINAIESVVHAFSRTRVQEAESAKGEFNTFINMLAGELKLSAEDLKEMRNGLAENRDQLDQIAGGQSLHEIRLRVANRFKDLFSRGAYKNTSLNTRLLNALLGQVTGDDGNPKYYPLQNDQLSFLLLPLLLVHTPGSERNEAIRESLSKQLHALLSKDLTNLNESMVVSSSQHNEKPSLDQLPLDDMKNLEAEDRAPERSSKVTMSTLSVNRAEIARNLEQLFHERLSYRSALSIDDKQAFRSFAKNKAFSVEEAGKLKALSIKNELNDSDKSFISVLAQNRELSATERKQLNNIVSKYALSAAQKRLVSQRQADMEGRAAEEGVFVTPAKGPIQVCENYRPNFAEKQKMLEDMMLKKQHTGSPQQDTSRLGDEHQEIKQKLNSFFANKILQQSTKLDGQKVKKLGDQHQKTIQKLNSFFSNKLTDQTVRHDVESDQSLVVK